MIAEEWSKNEVSERSKSNDESSKWAEEWSKSEVIERRKSNDESSKCSKCAQKMINETFFLDSNTPNLISTCSYVEDEPMS